MLRAVSFDFGGTLDGPGRDWYTRLKELAGDESPWEEFYPRCRRAGNALARAPGVERMGLEESVRTMCLSLFEEEAKAKEVAALFVRDARAWLAKSRPVLERLAERYRLALVSNNFGNAAGWLEDEGLAPLFSVVVDSAAAGVSKPDRGIFLKALKEMGVEPREAAHVGDSFEKDAMGAAACGMKAVWIRPPGSAPADSTPHVAISTLDELPAALERLERDTKEAGHPRD